MMIMNSLLFSVGTAEMVNHELLSLYKNGCRTYDDFKNLYSNKWVTISLELTPDKNLSTQQSVERHFSSNLEQIFIGGAVATIKPTDDPSIINVEIENTTGMKSLFLHITDNETIQGNRLSNKKQIVISNIKIQGYELFEE